MCVSALLLVILCGLAGGECKSSTRALRERAAARNDEVLADAGELEGDAAAMVPEAEHKEPEVLWVRACMCALECK